MQRQKKQDPAVETVRPNREVAELENELIRRIEQASYIIDGLRDNGPYKAMVGVFKETRDAIDATWHLVGDPTKLAELRMTKMAAETLINYIPNMEADRRRLQEELVKMQNPDEIIHKDYDNG